MRRLREHHVWVLLATFAGLAAAQWGGAFHV